MNTDSVDPEDDCNKLRGRGNKPNPIYDTENNPDFSVYEGQLTFDAEKNESDSRYNSRTVHYPGGASGVTIGPGYDLKERGENNLKKNSILQVLKKIGLSQQAALHYQKGAGKEGKQACDFIHSNKNNLVVITPRQQKDLFELIYPFFQAEVVRLASQPTNLSYGVLDWKRLSLNARALLTDLKYRGDFHSGTWPKFLSFLCDLSVANADEQLSKLRTAMSDEVYWRGKRPKPNVPENRFNQRKNFTNNDINKLIVDSVEWGYIEKTVWDLEQSHLSPVGYDRFKKDDGWYGIAIGKGFTLGKRKCFRGREIHEQNVQEIEIEKYLRYAGVTDETSLNSFKGAAAKTGKKAIDLYLNSPAQTGSEETHREKMKITDEVEKKLFNLVFAQYEADVRYICGGMIYTGAYGAYNWSKLNPKIKAILIDMAFTDHMFANDLKHQIVRGKLLPHVANNDLEKFTQAIKGWRKWPQFKSAAAQQLWKTRFTKRIRELELREYEPLDLKSNQCTIETSVPLIFPPQNRERSVSLLTKNKTDESLPVLEPATIASPNFDFERMGQKIASELIKTDELIPKLIKLTRVFQGDDPKPKIVDIFLPATTHPLFIKNAFVKGEPIKTRTLKVEGIDLPKVKKGMRVRLEKKGNIPFQYVYIKKDPVGDTLELLEEIDLSELASGSFHVDATFFLPLNKMSLGGLFGEKLPSIDIMLSGPGGQLQFASADKNGNYHLPLVLDIFFPKFSSTDRNIEYQHLSLLMNLGMKHSQGNWRLTDTTIYLSLPAAEEEVLEFEVFSILFPSRKAPSEQATNTNYDVSIDLKSREVIFSDHSSVKPELYFPGGLKKEIDAANGNREKIEKAKQKRFLCEFIGQKISEENPEKYFLRLNKQGISFEARVVKRNVTLLEGDQPIQMTPKGKSGQFEGKIRIRNNNIEAASVGATLQVPGFQDLNADISVGIRKHQPDSPPIVTADIALKNNNSLPLAELSIKYLQMQLTKLRLTLDWELDTNRWNIEAIADGMISFTGAAQLVDDLAALKTVSAIEIENLNLLHLRLPDLKIALKLSKDINFNILSGLFGFTLKDLSLSFSGNSFALHAKNSEVRFNRPGAFEVTIGTKSADPSQDALVISYKNSKFDFDIKQPLSISVRLGPNISFKGSAGWVEDSRGERFFFAQGAVSIDGLPSFKGLLKFGTIKKNNGDNAPNIVLYGAQDVDIELYPGVVVKNIGCGIGINNSLRGVDATPNEQEILDNLDKITPEEYSGWQGVKDNGFYLSIVGSTILSSNLGSRSKVSAYVAELIMSLDTELNAIAAGRLWLSSSVDKALKHRQNPLMVGAVALSTKQKRLGARLQTRPRPYIEDNAWLKKIVELFQIKIAFRLTPQLVDYHIEELRFSDEFWGVSMQYIASYRFAVFRRAVLLRSSQSVSGHFSKEFRKGAGGIEFSGRIALAFAYAGLLTEKGLIAYGKIETHLHFAIKAFIEIGFRKTIGAWKWKKTISWTERFKASLSANIFFSGKAAIVESGRFGFNGTASVAVSVRGYPLSIHTSFNYRPHIVSQATRRIASYERDLERVGRGVTNFQLSFQDSLFRKLQKSSPDKETWYYYGKGKFHLFLPAENTPWFIPRYNKQKKSLINEVKKLKIGDLPEGEFSYLWNELSPKNPQLENALSFFIASSTQRDAEELEKQIPIPLSDPRVESDNREYLPFSEQNRPQHYRSFEFRDLSEVLRDPSSAPSRDELKKIKKYLKATERLSTDLLHSIENEDEFEESKQNRGKTVQALLNDLDNPEGPQLFGSYAVNDSNLGVIFEHENKDAILQNIREGKIQIYRGNEYKTITCINFAEQTTDFSKLIFPLLIRQKHVEKDETVQGEEKDFAKTYVKLPINIDKLISEQKLPAFSHFQIFRQFPDQEKPELIEEFARPGMFFVQSPEMRLRVQFKNNSFQLQSDDPSILPLLSSIDPQCCFLYIETPAEQKLIQLDQLSFDQAKVLNFITKEHSLSEKDFSEIPDAQFTLLVNPTKTILVDPYLYTDAFYFQGDTVFVKRIVNGKSEMQKTGLIPDISEIHYFIRVVPSVEQKGTEEQRILHFPEPLKLHIPKTTKFPKELAIVFPVDSLLEKETQPPVCQFIDLETKLPEALKQDSFELWVKQVPLHRNGFYAGEKESFGSKNSKSAHLDNIEQDEPSESIIGKTKILPKSSTQYSFKLEQALALLPKGFGYQFFIRETTDDERVLLKPLKHVLIKSFPNTWHKNVKIKLIEQFEWIPQSEEKRLALTEDTFLDSASFFISNHYDNEANSIDINFSSFGIYNGGAEIYIQDRDEPLSFQTQTCELLNENLFVEDIRTFTESSIWEVSPKQTIAMKSPKKRKASKEILDDQIGIHYFNFETSKSTIIENLRNAGNDLSTILRQGPYNWRDNLYPNLLNYLSAVADFEKSPLNIHSETVNEQISHIKNLAANLILGSKLGSTFEKALIFVETTEDKIAKRIQVAENSNPNTQTTGIEGDEYQDVQEARLLLGIIRRRMAICSEMFRYTEQVKLPFENYFSAPSDEEFLPSLNRWKESKATTEGMPTPYADEIFNQFNTWDIPKKEREENPDQPPPIIEIRKNLIDAISGLKNKIQEDAPKLGKILPHASAIAELLDSIETADGLILDKRPHHIVTTDFDRESSTGEKIPKTVDFQSFLSKTLEEKILPFDFSKSVAAFFNLIEYLGFAIDLSIKTETGLSLSQDKILSEVQEKIQIPQNASVYLLRPSAPVVVGNTENALGYNFIKVAIIPDDLLSSPNSWLTYRGITKNVDLELFNDILSYIEQLSNEPNTFKSIQLQPWDKRWLSLPVRGGEAETSYRIPDPFGHRYRVAIRSMSRYEPLLLWYKGMSSFPALNPKKLETEIFSKNVEIFPTYHSQNQETGEVIEVFTIPDPVTAQFTYQLPSDAGRGMKNQIAAIRSGYKGSDLVFQHEQINRSENSLSSIANEILFCEGTLSSPARSITTISYETSNEITLYNHERLVQIPDLPHYYSYSLSARPLYDSPRPISESFFSTSTNLDSNGNQLVIEKPKTTPRLPWILELESKNSGEIQRCRVVNKKISEKENLLLELTEHIEKGSYSLKLYPQAPSTTVEPRHLALYQPDIKKIREVVKNPEEHENTPTIDFSFTIYLSKNIDHYVSTDVSIRSNEPSPFKIPADEGENKFFYTYEMPELSTDYLIYWEVQSHEENDLYYLPVAAIRMPWSEEGNGAKLPVLKQLTDGISLLDDNGEPVNPFPEEGQPLRISCYESMDSTLSRYQYALHFQLRIEPNNVEEGFYTDPRKYVIQANRQKAQTHAMRFNPVGDS